VRDFIPDRGFTFKLQGGHTGGVFATFIHAPGNGTSPPLIITGSDDKTAIVWNLHTGERVRRLEGGHTKTITSIGVYTPVHLTSASLVVTASKDSTAVVWELNTGKVVHKLKGGHGVHEISSVVVYSPPIASIPPLIVTAGWDHLGVVWDLITGQQMYRLEDGHKRGITSMALYSPLDGTPPLVITGGADDLCVVWNLTNGQIVRKLEGAHSDRIYAVTVHAPEGGTCPPLVITGSEDKTAVVWDLQSGSVLSKLESGHTATITGIAVYSPPDGVSSPLVLTAGEDKVAVVWDLVTGTQVRRLTGCHTASLHAAAVYAPRGGRGSPLFITGAQDKTAVIWDLWSSEQVRKLEGGHTKPIKAVAVYIPPDNTIPAVIITGSYDKTAIVWDLQTQQIMHTLENGHTGEITSVVVYTPPSPKASPLVITGSEDKTAVVWDVFTGQQLHKLKGGHTDWITCLAVFESADRMSPPLIISGGYDKTAIVWDLGTGKLIRKLAGEHTAALTSVAVFVPAVDSYATPLIVTGGEDKSIVVWDLESGHVVRRLAAHTAGVTALLVHAPTDLTVQVVSVSSDKSAIVWDLHSGKIVRKLENLHKESISSVAMFNTGDPTSPPLVITASQDKTMLVWELGTGKIVRVLDGVHSKAISSVAVYEPKDHHSPPLVITGSHDGTAAVWKNALLTFEFMPLMDEILRLFQADVETFHTAPEPWSRINAIVSRYGEGFWFENHGLFRAALVEVKDAPTRDSFFNTFASVLTRVVHLIPLTAVGKQAKCVLQISVERKLRIRHLIFDAWLSVLNSHDADFLWQVFHPSMSLRRSALLALSDIYPAEFVDFICKLRLVRSHPLLYRGVPSYFIDNFSGMVIEGMPAAITVDMWTKVAGYHSDINDTNAQPITAYMLPLAAAADMKLLQAYVDVSDSLDDLAIFNSDIGSVAFRYAWRSFGKDAHINAMMYYALFVAVYTCSVVVFDRLHQSDHAYGPVLAWILQAYVLRLVVKYIVDEIRQCYNDYSIRLRRNNERMHSIARVVTEGPVGEKLVPGQHRRAYLHSSKRFRYLRKFCSRSSDYIRTLTAVKVFKIVYRHFSDFWNMLDLAVILIVLLGTLLRCCYGRETDRSRDVLAIGCVLVWFKLLYFMRPFKGSGPLGTYPSYTIHTRGSSLIADFLSSLHSSSSHSHDDPEDHVGHQVLPVHPGGRADRLRAGLLDDLVPRQRPALRHHPLLLHQHLPLHAGSEHQRGLRAHLLAEFGRVPARALHALHDDPDAEPAHRADGEHLQDSAEQGPRAVAPGAGLHDAGAALYPHARCPAEAPPLLPRARAKDHRARGESQERDAPRRGESPASPDHARQRTRKQCRAGKRNRG
jgi:WD40 repeat protein